MSRNNRIENKFIDLKNSNKKALIPFITAGYPDYNIYLELFYKLDKLGADIIEIGMPFSDPMADGPVIQQSSKAALERGFNTDLLFKSVKEIRKKTETPIAVMTYFNIIYSYGIEKFLTDAKNSGIDGLIIPDLPLEEFFRYKSVFTSVEESIANIMLATLDTDDLKIREISKFCSGFLYCVLLKGVTGAKNKINPETIEFLKRVRNNSGLPLAVGFGMSEAAQIRQIRDFCDGIIIGSKIISFLKDRLQEPGSEYEKKIEKGFKDIEEFINKIKHIL